MEQFGIGKHWIKQKIETNELQRVLMIRKGYR